MENKTKTKNIDISKPTIKNEIRLLKEVTITNVPIKRFTLEFIGREERRILSNIRSRINTAIIENNDRKEMEQLQAVKNLTESQIKSVEKVEERQKEILRQYRDNPTPAQKKEKAKAKAEQEKKLASNQPYDITEMKLIVHLINKSFPNDNIMEYLEDILPEVLRCDELVDPSKEREDRIAGMKRVLDQPVFGLLEFEHFCYYILHILFTV